MSSSYIQEPRKDKSKKDDTLIIMFNEKGGFSVDQYTLQNLLVSQSKATVSVVKVNHNDENLSHENVVLTVDPPNFATSDSSLLIDPFMEMDSEQLERLETALQSEQAKHILGENVTAMLDMLTIEEQQNTIKYNISLDHCYTSKIATLKTKDKELLIESNRSEKNICMHTNLKMTPKNSTDISLEIPKDSSETVKIFRQDNEFPKIIKQQPISLRGRSKRNPKATYSSPDISTSNETAQKQTHHLKICNDEHDLFLKNQMQNLDNFENFITTEPVYQKSGIETDKETKIFKQNFVCRGAKRGLTTRGGIMNLNKRRNFNKQMDYEQAKRLDSEMAAAVNAMKTSENYNNINNFENLEKVKLENLEIKVDSDCENKSQQEKRMACQTYTDNDLFYKNKNQSKVTKSNESSADIAIDQEQIAAESTSVSPSPIIEEKISVDSVFEKIPSVMSKIKSQNISLSKTTPVIKNVEILSSPISVNDNTALIFSHRVTDVQTELIKNGYPEKKSEAVISKKLKTNDAKKDNKVISLDNRNTDEFETLKGLDIRNIEGSKKLVKKEHRKFDADESFGPALFSAPDIIRRVESSSEFKIQDNILNKSTFQAPLSNVSSINTSPTCNIDFTVSKIEPNNPVTLQNIETDNLLITTKHLNEKQGHLGCNISDTISCTLDSTIRNLNISPTSRLSSNDQSNRKEDKIKTPSTNASNVSQSLDILTSSLNERRLKSSEELARSSELLKKDLFSDRNNKVNDLDTSMKSSVNYNLYSSEINNEEEVAKKEWKDSTNQIVRSGKVITLPPIEAPTTRSKRLLTNSDGQSKPSEKSLDKSKIGKADNLETCNSINIKRKNTISKGEDIKIDTSDSEDDPNRLWCICRQPHNGRFMICCDICEEWFHGRCVNVTKSMGEQMESEGTDWICPNCLAKSDIKKKPLKTKEQTFISKFELPAQTTISSPKVSLNQDKYKKINEVSLKVTICAVCKTKEARNSSIYCSDDCILAHAEVTSSKDKNIFYKNLKKTTSINEVTDINSQMSINQMQIKDDIKEQKESSKVFSQNTLHKEHSMEKIENITSSEISRHLKSNIKISGKPKIAYPKINDSKQTILGKDFTNDTLKKNIIHQQKKVHIEKKIDLKQMKINFFPIQSQLKLPETPSAKSKSTKSLETQQSVSLMTKKSDSEITRSNVQTTLFNALITRLKEDKDVSLKDEEISELCLNIELELFKYFKGTGTKYKSKYRSLLFNIKDPKNQSLYKKIAIKSITPEAVIKLSSEDLANQELAEWREKENKHQLEMIKKNELDMLASNKSIFLKTHKGEQIIENEALPVQDTVTDILNSATESSSRFLKANIKEDKYSKELNRESMIEARKSKTCDSETRRGRSRERSKKKNKTNRSKSRVNKRKNSKRDHSKVRDRSKNKKSKKKYKEKNKKLDKESDEILEMNKIFCKVQRKDKKIRSSSEIQINQHKHSLEEKKKYNDFNTNLAEKPLEDRLWRHIEEESTNNPFDGNETDLSDREPSSTVTIKTPDINEEITDFGEDTDFNEKHNSNILDPLIVWRGLINMVDVAKFNVTANDVSGYSRNLMVDIPELVNVVGRISPDIVWDYISKMKKNPSKEIILLRLTAINDEEKIPYFTLYSYLNSRNRLGVVHNKSENIKDFYIMPFSNRSYLPPVLLPLSVANFETNRPHLLLGIIVYNRKKRMMPHLISPIPTKVAKLELNKNNPQAIFNLNTEDTSKMHKNFDKQDVCGNNPLSKILDTAVMTSNKLEISSKLSIPKSYEDEPYSPGEPVENSIEDLCLLNVADTTCMEENTQDIDRQMKELNKKIEEKKQQIQYISSTSLSDSTTNLTGLNLQFPVNKEKETKDKRSFTPPPQNFQKLSSPLLETVSSINIPPNLTEILENVKRQENVKIDSYLPSKPGATFLSLVDTCNNQKIEKSSIPDKTLSLNKKIIEDEYPAQNKHNKSTLSLLSDADLIKKAEEQLALQTQESQDLKIAISSAPFSRTSITSSPIIESLNIEIPSSTSLEKS